MLIDGMLAGAAFACAIICAGMYAQRKRKDQELLSMALIALLGGVVALLWSASLLPVTLPLTAALVVAAGFFAWRERRRSHT